MLLRTSSFAVLGMAIGLAVAIGEVRADAADTLVEQCHVQLNLSDSACECIGNKAREELSPQQQDLVAAHITDDSAAIESLQSQMTVEEMTEAGEWMMNTPAACQ
jgi:hypothetical protein